MNFLFARSVHFVVIVVLILAAANVSLSQSQPGVPAGPSPSTSSRGENKENREATSFAEPKTERESPVASINNDPDIRKIGIDSSSLVADKYGRSGAFETLHAIPANPQSSSDDSGWQFALAPYLFAAGISGKVGARGREIEVQSSFGNVWHNLDIGFMGAFEVRKHRFVNFNDMIWTKLSDTRDTPGPFYSTAKLGINLLVLDPEVGYRVIDSKRGFLDVLGGARIWSVETNINVTTGILQGFDVSQRKTWGAPVVGLRGNYNVTRRFFLSGKFDIGGAGIGADLTTQLYGAGGYKLTKNFALIGGYRWLQVRYDDSKGFLFDTRMSGLMFGGRLSF